ncbi:MAG TPA: RdgB/HAM1 family non-canonical purine NTP pyrophosphatase [Anaeromyxobacteraceae bacterium]|nr:RdgB/HAM1 family non-canonical purine NTP pyrophosphatase [Anaeromyxobacteraceae bacterium]
MDLVFATGNPGKLRELRRLVAGLPVRVLSLAEAGGGAGEVVEDGSTFAENARKKASAHARATGRHALADDSGLCVDALWGRPGIRSARYSEEERPGLAGVERDRANNEKLLFVLRGVFPEHRGAEYRAVVALAAPDGTVIALAEGSCRGAIVEEPRGEGGFGYDPLFAPEATPGRTMAELGPQEKDAISHRGEALRKLLPALREVLATL